MCKLSCAGMCKETPSEHLVKIADFVVIPSTFYIQACKSHSAGMWMHIISLHVCLDLLLSFRTAGN